jgi:hypothetical protein
MPESGRITRPPTPLPLSGRCKCGGERLHRRDLDEAGLTVYRIEEARAGSSTSTAILDRLRF